MTTECELSVWPFVSEPTSVTNINQQNRNSSRIPGRLSSLFILAVFALPAPLLAQSLPSANSAVSDAPHDPLNDLVDRAIATADADHRLLNTQVHTPWRIAHGLLALRNDLKIRHNGIAVNAIDWVSNGARFQGDAWFEVTEHGGRAHPYNGTPYDFEGHVNQFLAILAMSNLPLDHEFQTGDGRTVTMQQMIDHAKMAVSSHVEITWTLWFLTHYLDQDEEWLNEKNEPWSMERLVRMQIQDSPYDSPCGGTHGMFALAYARNSYLKKHGQLRGVWLEADQKLQRYLIAAQRMQNRDGSFATNYFKSTGYSTDFNERITYSGHMLEWIMVALPKSRLKENWIRLGVQTLCYDLIRNSHVTPKYGPYYHAIHSLVLYRNQVNPETTLDDPATLIAQDAKPIEVAKEPVQAEPKPIPIVIAKPKTVTQQQPVSKQPVVQPEIPRTQVPATRTPTRVATEPQDYRSIRRDRRMRRRTSSVDVDESVEKQEIEHALPATLAPTSKLLAVAMPILKSANKDDVASTLTGGSEDDETLPLPPLD